MKHEKLMTGCQSLFSRFTGNFLVGGIELKISHFDSKMVNLNTQSQTVMKKFHATEKLPTLRSTDKRQVKTCSVKSMKL